MSIGREELIRSLTAYIRNEITPGQEGLALQPDDDLLEGSIVDSMGIMRLVAHIEQTYGFTVPAEDVTVENFLTINAIADYLSPQLSEHVD